MGKLLPLPLLGLKLNNVKFVLGNAIPFPILWLFVNKFADASRKADLPPIVALVVLFVLIWAIVELKVVKKNY